VFVKKRYLSNWVFTTMQFIYIRMNLFLSPSLKNPGSADVRTCKANVVHLDENINALWLWLNSGKSNKLANPCIQNRYKDAKWKSHGINIFWVGW